MKGISRGAYVVGWLCAMAAGMLVLKEPTGVAVFGLAVPVFALLWHWLEVAVVNETYQRDLHELRVALAILGDPDKLLRRLDELQEAAAKVKLTPERVEEVLATLKSTTGGLNERLVKVETMANALQRDGILDKRMRFGSGA